MRRLLSLVVVAACAACGDGNQGASRGTPQVLLHHCGVQPVTYGGRSWEVEAPPFDQGNAPDSFSGFGEFSQQGETLTFTDRDGARLTFVVDDGTPDPYTCA